jgi:hypothetical protein
MQPPPIYLKVDTRTGSCTILNENLRSFQIMSGNMEKFKIRPTRRFPEHPISQDDNGECLEGNYMHHGVIEILAAKHFCLRETNFNVPTPTPKRKPRD